MDLTAALRRAVRPMRRRPPRACASTADDQLIRGIELEYPLRAEPRYPMAQAANPHLRAIIDRGREGYRRLLESFLLHRDCLVRIPLHASADDLEPFWVNDWMAGLDVVALHSMLAQVDPRRYVEVGSGISTRVARRTIRDHGLRTEVVSIDPCPRVEIDALCDRVLRQPLDAVDLAAMDELEPGDILYVDGSHRCFMNSDVTVLFLDILPRLRSGVLVHLHDVFLPYDYPHDWARRLYSEQYVLAAALLAGGATIDIVLPDLFISYDPDLSQVLAPLWHEPALAGVAPHGVSFWMRRT